VKRVAISIGDLNGIGLELALKNHREISKSVQPIYMVDMEMVKQGAKLLEVDVPDDFQTIEGIGEEFQIVAGEVSRESGLYSYHSFISGVNLVKDGEADAIVTLPINKESWSLAGVEYKGHTDALRDIFDRDAIMLMGVPEMFVALFTEHIPYGDVPSMISEERLYQFFKNLYREIPNMDRVGVLGLNPHAGDNGVLGYDEVSIKKGVEKINSEIGRDIFSQPLVPDVAFTPHMRDRYNLYVAMYHDQGLAPLKALYFHEVINISLNLPIQRVSVGHGTAFDMAYRKDRELDSRSYLNSISYLLS
jgi:4-hydroxythreonine-4-phosphate dehydrogenase